MSCVWVKRVVFSFLLLIPTAGTCAIPPVSKQKIEYAIEQAKKGVNSANELSLAHRRVTCDEVSKVLKLDKPLSQQELKKANVPYVFSLSSRNAKPGQAYVLLGRDCSGHFEELGTFTAGKDGVLKNSVKSHQLPLSRQLIYHSEFMASEAIDYLLVSLDGKQVAATHIAPKPIEVQGKDHGKLSLELAKEDGKTFKLYLNNFQPGERYRYLIDSHGHETMGTGVVSERGEAVVVVSISEGEGGIADLAFQSDTQSQPVSLHFKWGKALVESLASN